jgi:dipeptidyl aminopeptidase/acylaminoacyl peptidase
MMTYQAIRDGFPANAAAVYGAFTDLGALIQSDPARYEALASRIWPDYERDQDAILQRRSAVAWSAKLDVPLLILHGGADGDVDPQQSLELAERLNAQKKEFELTIYANDDHVLSDHRTDRDARAIAWFERHMR